MNSTCYGSRSCLHNFFSGPSRCLHCMCRPRHIGRISVQNSPRPREDKPPAPPLSVYSTSARSWNIALTWVTQEARIWGRTSSWPWTWSGFSWPFSLKSSFLYLTVPMLSAMSLVHSTLIQQPMFYLSLDLREYRGSFLNSVKKPVAHITLVKH